ncbi:MAG: hypothetical protein E7294_08705 [Lachnospiraceae bacterium]|jgi:hypothetical protein|nr:hypothetical protein [Lachnospiraceae bacterium]
MLKQPLSEQDIINVKDQYALVMDIWHEFERLAGTFAMECAEIRETLRTQTGVLKKDQDLRLAKMEEDHHKQMAALEREKKQTLEQMEEDYQQKREQLDQQMELAWQANESAKESAAKYQSEHLGQLQKTKQLFTHYIVEIEKAESQIKVKQYERIANSMGDHAYARGEDLRELMRNYELSYMVSEINKLDGKLLRSSELKAKCEEFHALKNKAKLLYDKEMELLKNAEEECTGKVSGMVKETEERFGKERARLEKEQETEKQAFIQSTLRKEQEYDLRSTIADQDYASARQALENGRANEFAQLEKESEALEDQAVKRYKEEQLKMIPPVILKQYVLSMEQARVLHRKDFTPAKEEPLNVTVGNIFFKFEQFMGNPGAKAFLEESYDFVLQNGALVFPYTVAINETLALCYKYDSDSSDSAKADAQTLCMSTFLATPPGKMRFYFIDPLKSGQTFAVFKHFEDDNTYGYHVIMGGIQTEPDMVQRQLQIVVDHIKTMQVNTFRGLYRNIRDYNLDNPLNPQPYSIVAIMDFPAGFTPKSIELLSQIVATGKQCGVYVLLMTNEEQLASLEPLLRAQIRGIEKMCNCFRSLMPGYYNISDVGKRASIRYIFDQPLNIEETIEVAPVMKKAIRDAGRIVIGYEHIAPKPEGVLTYHTDNGIDIPIGLRGASDIQSLRLGEAGSQSVHALIVGQIGSGKSRLLHAIITGALLKYSPEELQIYLVDFKSGTEFKIYADYNLPSFKVIAIESEQEFGLSVLKDLKNEADRRAKIFKDCTESDITSYNKSPHAAKYGRMPRVLVVIDEFHVLFGTQNPVAANEAAQIMDSILRLDRSYGFHVVLCSQSIRGMTAINEAAMAQVAVRIALKCPKEDAQLVLEKGADTIELIEENDAGSAIYVPAISSPNVNYKIRVGFLSQDMLTGLLEMLDQHYTQIGLMTQARVLAADVSESRNSVFQRYYANGELITKERILHLGESLKVNEKFEIRFDRADTNAMLMIGQDVQKAQNMLFFAALELVLQRIDKERKNEAPTSIYVMNYCDGSNDKLDDRLQDLGLSVPQYIRYYDGATAEREFDTVYQAFLHKKEEDPDVWLIISNLELARGLQSSGIYGSDRENAKRFEQILRDGPAVGFFTIVWCADPSLYKLKFIDTFRYFGKRIIFNVPIEDARELADIVEEESIYNSDAYFYQNGKGKEKIRPYQAPMQKWMRHLCDERLQGE